MHSGEAFVELQTRDELDEALAHHKRHLGVSCCHLRVRASAGFPQHRYIEVYQCTATDVERGKLSSLAKDTPQASKPFSERSSVVRLRGLPYNTLEQDVRTFLRGIDIGESSQNLPCTMCAMLGRDCEYQCGAAVNRVEILLLAVGSRRSVFCRSLGGSVPLSGFARDGSLSGVLILLLILLATLARFNSHPRRSCIENTRGFRRCYVFHAFRRSATCRCSQCSLLRAVGVHILSDKSGRPSGEAYVEVASHEAARWFHGSSLVQLVLVVASAGLCSLSSAH